MKLKTFIIIVSVIGIIIVTFGYLVFYLLSSVW